MKALVEAEQYVSGEALTPAKALRLAERLEKACAQASKADTGLLEVARERVLTQLLETSRETLRVGLKKGSNSTVVVRPGKGQRAPAASIGLDRLPRALRSALSEELHVEAPKNQESTQGIAVGTLDPAIQDRYVDQSASACLQNALSAEEQYDYDRALTGFQLAVIRSKGEVKAVRELVRFLTEVYSDLDAVVRLLQSPPIPTQKHRDLRIALARSCHKTGQFLEAATLYEQLLAQADDPDLLTYQAELDVQDGQFDKARKRLAAVLKHDPSHNQARSLLEQCNQSMHGEAVQWITRAEEALDKGAMNEAREALDELTRRNIHHPQMTELRSRLDAIEDEKKTRTDIEQATQWAAQGDWRQVIQRLRQAQQRTPSVVEETADLLQKAEQAVAKLDCTHHLEEAIQRHEAGNWAGSLRSFHRALSTNEPLPNTVADHPLLTLLQPTLATLGHSAPTDRTFDGLAALFDAQRDLQDEAWDEAEHHLRDARRHLRTHPTLDALESTLAEARAQSQESRLQALIADAMRLEKMDRLVDALEALDRAVVLNGGDFDETADWRNRLRTQTTQRSKQTSVHNRLKQLASQQEWWRLQRELKVASDVLRPDALADFTQQAQLGIHNNWRIETAPPPTGNPKGTLPLQLLDWSTENQHDVLIQPATNDPYLWVASQGSLARVSVPDLRIQTLYTLPAPIAISRSTTRLFETSDGLGLLDGETKTLTFLGFDAEQLCVKDRLDLSRILAGHSDPKRLVAETQVCPATGRLLILETQQARGRKSRLKSVGLEDGQVHHEEAFPYPVFNLKPIQGDTLFTVQRLLDWSRPQANFYNFALVDGHARIEKRIAFAELELPMHSIRHIARGDSETSDVYCQYNYLEPFTGQVSQGTCGFAQIRPDWNIYYQTNETERWFDEPRQIVGDFAVHSPTQSLIVPWRSLSDTPDWGVSVVAFKGFQHQWSTHLPTDYEWAGMVIQPSSGHPVVLIRNETGLQLHSLDMETKTLVV